MFNGHFTKLMIEGHFVTFHKLIKTQVNYSSIYSGGLVNSQKYKTPLSSCCVCEWLYFSDHHMLVN